ncbi:MULTISPECIES: BON domain-containing protein [unclassified Herbaspirillum]|uniref:BON domain-containing protein n=1 Tax=unclassified Herbaspirillum TaxID=2624150 RepID=UPI00114F0758|nr:MULTISPECIES: BON domain-containing protein [unclassified Herbaspirillum]MBB5391670.1 osmotically-inducible protein OsmY [Herbaspirillum sp. SJZ102]TQK03083.1 BON domain-containing protein [Herbaspirillum sp. SJZ130]TQK06529.1 BON domain-containing protein [Herbaspirillum sp. SJZ106]TWC62411.1 BON domain-containing protein [Herbaspirillum sp. SJZ099]
MTFNKISLSKRFAGFFLALLMVSLVGCASSPGKEGTGEYVDDAVITTKVKAALFNEPNLASSEINVETYKGVVQLSGFVSSATSATRATELARGVKGVVSVRNDLRLKQ